MRAEVLSVNGKAYKGFSDATEILLGAIATGHFSAADTDTCVYLTWIQDPTSSSFGDCKAAETHTVLADAMGALTPEDAHRLRFCWVLTFLRGHLLKGVARGGRVFDIVAGGWQWLAGGSGWRVAGVGVWSYTAGWQGSRTRPTSLHLHMRGSRSIATSLGWGVFENRAI